MCFLPLQQDFYSKSRHASPQNSSQIYAYVHLPPIVQCVMFPGRPSGRPCVVRLRDAISLYLVEGIRRNLLQTFIMRVGIAENIFKIRGQSSRS